MCGYCGVGCGLTLRVADGRVVSSTGRADHPANRGRLCTKGATTADMLASGGRQTTAELRVSRDDERTPVGLNTAISAAAARLRAIRDEHGPDAIALYLSGQMSLEAQYLATKLAKGYLGTKWVESNSRLCMASAGTGYKQSLGADGPPGSYDDLDHADVFLVMGANMADCHPILFLRMMDRVKAGAKLIVVDPRRTATAAKADLHLPIRPGTDLALLNGLLALIADRGALDAGFIEAHTDGWDAMPALLAEYPLERVAELTGLGAEDISAAADLIAGADNWTSLWTMGLNQSIHGTWNTIALCNLHLATGAICRTGSGPFSLTGQPNAMGGREMGYMGPGLPGQRSALDADDRRFVEEVWGLRDGTLRAEAGAGTVAMFEQLAAGNIKAAWIICTNPVASMANRANVIDGLNSAELVLVQEAFTGAETVGYADIVLPAALWAEADGVMVNSERTLTRCAPAMPPPGDALPDWKLICLIADELGYGPAFDFPDAAAVFDELTRFHNPRTGWDLRGVDHARLARGPVQWPAPPGAGDRNPIRYLDASAGSDGRGLRFATASGRAQFLPRPYLPPAELPDDDHPMLLTTGRLAHQWHTMTKTGRVGKLNKLNPAPFLQVHPEDAARFGLVAGGHVRLASRRGAATVPVAIDDAVRPGVCFAPMHFADAFGPEVSVNAVTNDAVDPESLQPEFKVCAVALTPVAAPQPIAAPTPVASAAAGAVSAAAGPLSVALGPYAAGPGELSAEAAGYLGGLLAGWSASAPDQAPAVPADAPLTPIARAWLEGVLAGVFGPKSEPGAQRPSVTVVWASQTGTAEGYAADCVAALAAVGITATVRGAEQVSPADLTGAVLFLVATTGDGDPPDNGVALWDALASAASGDLEALRFSVLGFGDPSYADFCGFARKLDARLEHLGGRRIAPRASCEPDYADTAAGWLAAVIAALGAGEIPGVGASAGDVVAAQPTPQPAPYSRTNPLRTRLLSAERLSGAGSAKDVRRFTFALPGAELGYRAGDALGVWPRNTPTVIETWCELTGMSPEEELERLDLTKITPAALRFVAERAADPDDLQKIIDEPSLFADWAWGKQLADLLIAHPVTAEPAQWRELLRPLAPRLYSISSSPREDPDRVSITVSVVGFDTDTGRRSGVCSSFLAGLADDEVELFVQPTRGFLPPADDAAAAVMIGPGTGIAPFRGFLHDRAGRGHRGDNWLFFGEQHQSCDFYYREELEKLQADGVLTRLDTAFSRDGDGKVYVQDRMREHAAELWSWIRRGAHLYVCGDAARMARDVDEALRGIVAEHGQMAARSADAYVKALAAEGRYVRDVY